MRPMISAYGVEQADILSGLAADVHLLVLITKLTHERRIYELSYLSAYMEASPVTGFGYNIVKKTDRSAFRKRNLPGRWPANAGISLFQM